MPTASEIEVHNRLVEMLERLAYLVLDECENDEFLEQQLGEVAREALQVVSAGTEVRT